MHLFCVKPTIHRFSTLAEFLSSFSVGQGDLLLTEQVLFRQYLEGRPLTCSGTLPASPSGASSPWAEAV